MLLKVINKKIKKLRNCCDFQNYSETIITAFKIVNCSGRDFWDIRLTSKIQ